MTESTGYVVVWACFCSDAAADSAELVPFCPGHAQPRIGAVVENERLGTVRPGHICRETNCPNPVQPPEEHTT